MKVLLDLDGVLVDFYRGVFDLEGCHDYFTDPTHHGVYSLPLSLWGMTTKEFWSKLDYNFWVNLKPTAECYQIIEMLESKFGRKNICILSTPTLHPSCIAGKLTWINKNIPDYKRQYLIGPRKEFCAHDDALLIDDCDDNIVKFIQNNGNAILVPRIWNSQHRNRDHVIPILKRALNDL